MTLFWTITAAMIAVALAILARTLLREYARRSDNNEAFNVEIAREHLTELVKQKDTGELSDEEFAQARKDLEIALAQDLEGENAPRSTTAGRSGGRWALLVSALLIPLVTVPVYLEIGSPQLIDPQAHGPATVGHGADSELPPMSDLAAQLRQRMEANPDNAEGWFLLGRTYMRLQQYADAVYAFERVVKLLPDEAAGLLSLADAMAMRDGRQVGARAVELLEKALSIEPDSVTALWLLGNAAMDRGDTATALGYWQRAYPLLTEEPAMQADLGQMIAQAGGEPPLAPAALPPIMSAANTTEPPPATAGGEGQEGAAIVVEVALAPALMEQVAATDTLFVLARAASGPPMPLAVARHQVAELPLRVTLTDAMAMMPAMKLSSFDQVRVTAKISKSGRAGAEPGDLTAPDVLVDSANPPESVRILIDQVVE
jgi:cytochrome c-type biogenesis protein CcmH